MRLSNLAEQAIPLIPGDPGIIVVPGNIEDAIWHDNTFYAVYKRVLGVAPDPYELDRKSGLVSSEFPRPPAHLHTDDDAFGLVRIRFTPTYERTVYELPLVFPIQSNGAVGLKRTVALGGVHQGRVLMKIQSPFYDNRGWGNDNFLYGLDPSSETWYRVTPEKSYVPVEPGTPALPSQQICGGESLVFVTDDDKIAVVIDGTAYHWEDSSIKPKTRRLLAEANRVREQQRLAMEGVFLRSFRVDDTTYWLVKPLRQYFENHYFQLPHDDPAVSFELPRGTTYVVYRHDPALLGDLELNFTIGGHGYYVSAPALNMFMLRFYPPDRYSQETHLVLARDVDWHRVRP